MAPLGSPYPGCLDRLSQLNISDEGLFRGFFRLRDLAMTLKATPRREFDADRWRAMTVIAMCGVWDFVITGREGLAFQNPATTQLWHPDAPGALPTDVAAAYQGYQACDPTRSYEDAYRDLVALCPTARAIYNTYYAGLFPPLPASVCP